jgi:hypothetical protein
MSSIKNEERDERRRLWAGLVETGLFLAVIGIFIWYAISNEVKDIDQANTSLVLILIFFIGVIIFDMYADDIIADRTVWVWFGSISVISLLLLKFVLVDNFGWFIIPELPIAEWIIIVMISVGLAKIGADIVVGSGERVIQRRAEREEDQIKEPYGVRLRRTLIKNRYMYGFYLITLGILVLVSGIMQGWDWYFAYLIPAILVVPFIIILVSDIITKPKDEPTFLTSAWLKKHQALNTFIVLAIFVGIWALLVFGVWNWAFDEDFQINFGYTAFILISMGIALAISSLIHVFISRDIIMSFQKTLKIGEQNKDGIDYNYSTAFRFKMAIVLMFMAFNSFIFYTYLNGLIQEEMDLLWGWLGVGISAVTFIVFIGLIQYFYSDYKMKHEILNPKDTPKGWLEYPKYPAYIGLVGFGLIMVLAFFVNWYPLIEIFNYHYLLVLAIVIIMAIAELAIPNWKEMEEVKIKGKKKTESDQYWEAKDMIQAYMLFFTILIAVNIGQWIATYILASDLNTLAIVIAIIITIEILIFAIIFIYYERSGDKKLISQLQRDHHMNWRRENRGFRLFIVSVILGSLIFLIWFSDFDLSVFRIGGIGIIISAIVVAVFIVIFLMYRYDREKRVSSKRPIQEMTINHRDSEFGKLNIRTEKKRGKNKYSFS